MDYTYQFENHLREHGPSRRGQRLWWIPAAAAAVLVLADAVYLATKPSDQVSSAHAVSLLFVAAFLVVVAWAVLSIADWTYAREKYYREAQHAAASQVRAYVDADRGDVAHQPPAETQPPLSGSRG